MILFWIALFETNYFQLSILEEKTFIPKKLISKRNCQDSKEQDI